MDKDIQAKVQAAIKAGANPQEAMRRGQVLQSNRQPQSVLQGNFASDNLVQNNGLVGGIVNSLARPFVKTGQMVGGSAFEVARSALAQNNPSVYKTDPNTRKHIVQNPFLSQETLENTHTNPGSILGQQALQSAAVASYGIPVGGATKLAGKVIAPGAFKGGALVGGLQAASDPNANSENIFMGALTGGAVGKGLQVGGKALNTVRKGGQNIEKLASNKRVGKVYTKASIGGAGDEKAAELVMAKREIKGPPQKRYELLEPTMNQINDEIKTVLLKNPRKISTESLRELFKKKIVPYVRQGDVTLEEALQGFDEYIDNVRSVSPKDLETNLGLFSIKKDVQSGMSSMYKKLENGGSLTTKEKALKAIRDTLDEALPEVKELTYEQSKLYDAAPSISAARKTNPTTRILGNTIPKGIYNKVTDTATAGIERGGRLAGKLPNVSLPKGTQNLAARGGSLLGGEQVSAEQGMVSPDQLGGGEQQGQQQPFQITPQLMMAVEMSGASDSTKQRFRKAYEFQKSIGGGGGKLTEKQTAYQSASQGAQHALNLLESGSAKTGPGTRTTSGIRRTFGLSSNEQQDFEGTLALARGYLLNALSGANVPPSEYQRLASLLEIEGSNPDTAKQQLRTFIRESQRFLGQEVAPAFQINQMQQPFQY